MGKLFSDEMELAINRIIDKRLKHFHINEHGDALDSLVKIVEELREEVDTLQYNMDDKLESDTYKDDFREMLSRVEAIEEGIDDIRSNQENFVEENSIQDLVSKTMLLLMPNFIERIAKEVKKHFMAMASFINSNFKEKE